MMWLEKCLSHKHEDLGLVPQNALIIIKKKKQGVATCSCNPRAGEDRRMPKAFWPTSLGVSGRQKDCFKE